MPNTTIQIKSSGTVSNVPSAVSLANGELALNYADEKLYFKNSSGVVKSFSTTGGTASPGGLNREVQFNDAGSLAGNSAFTFDKTTSTLTVGLPSSNSNTIIQPSLVATDRFIKSDYPIVSPTNSKNLGTGYLNLKTVINSGKNPNAIAIDPIGEFAYVANYSSSTINQFIIDKSTGSLTNNGVIVAGTNPFKIITEPSGRFVYCALRLSNLNQYQIIRSNGALSNVGTIASETYDLVSDPTGRFIYSVSSDGTIKHYKINQSNGQLNLISTDTTFTTLTTRLIKIDPTGRFLYVGEDTDNTLGVFKIDQITGSLTSVGFSPLVNGFPSNSIIDPTGRFLYLMTSGALYQYKISLNTGLLTEIANTVGEGGASSAPSTSMAIDSEGKFLYTVFSPDVVPSVSSKLNQYKINQFNGSLTKIANSNITYSNSLQIHPTDNFLYICNYSSNTVSNYIVNNFSAGDVNLAGSITANSYNFSDGSTQTTAATMGIIYAAASGYPMM